MRVVSAEQEKYNGHAQEEFFGRRVLVAIVDLFPHVQIIICASVELEWYASDPVEHEIGPKHVDDVGESPRYLLRHARNYVEEDLEANDEDEVYGPGTYFTGLCQLWQTWFGGGF